MFQCQKCHPTFPPSTKGGKTGRRKNRKQFSAISPFKTAFLVKGKEANRNSLLSFNRTECAC
jgi:hypothetical protein